MLEGFLGDGLVRAPVLTYLCLEQLQPYHAPKVNITPELVSLLRPGSPLQSVVIEEVRSSPFGAGYRVFAKL